MPSKISKRFLKTLEMFWIFPKASDYHHYKNNFNRFCFIAAYEEFEDMNNDLLDHNVEGVFMERLRAFYFYRDIEDDDDNLRVFHTVPVEITYKMALKRNTTCNFLEKNFCFRHRLENPLIDSLVKNYTTPLRVFNACFVYDILLNIVINFSWWICGARNFLYCLRTKVVTKPAESFMFQ